MLDPVVVPALGETPLFHPGDRVRISATPSVTIGFRRICAASGA